MSTLSHPMEHTMDSPKNTISTISSVTKFSMQHTTPYYPSSLPSDPSSSAVQPSPEAENGQATGEETMPPSGHISSSPSHKLFLSPYSESRCLGLIPVGLEETVMRSCAIDGCRLVLSSPFIEITIPSQQIPRSLIFGLL